jgi:hypothetical protein
MMASRDGGAADGVVMDNNSLVLPVRIGPFLRL